MTPPTKNAVPPTFEHRASFPLPVPPERAFRALSEAGELEAWFAERARVEARPGGAYRFYGRATLGAPGEAEATQTLTAFEPGRALSFRWALCGVDTEVTFAVRPGEAEGASVLEVTHAVFGELPFRNARHVVDDLWRLHAGNLSAHLEGEGGAVLPDFASPKPEVRLSVEINAPPPKVFKALLDPALMNRWLGGAARVDLASGAYSYGWSYEIEGRSVDGGPTRILEFVENERLVTDWTDWRGDPAKPPTRVTWRLEPLAGGKCTRLTLVHDGFELPVDRSDYQQGWGGFLDGLRKVAEG